jgi:hypothetical protein
MNRPFRGREITEMERGGADAILVGVGRDRDETWAGGGACTFQLHPVALVAPPHLRRVRPRSAGREINIWGATGQFFWVQTQQVEMLKVFLASRS